jgi:hypothetical protein
LVDKKIQKKASIKNELFITIYKKHFKANFINKKLYLVLLFKNIFFSEDFLAKIF